jgi:hypothetical protein
MAPMLGLCRRSHPPRVTMMISAAETKRTKATTAFIDFEEAFSLLGRQSS